MNMEPLAKKLEPKSLNDVLGQKHLIGKGAILRNLVEKKKLVSMILYGKPGIGKTSIAKSIVNDLDMPYRFLNATINNKKDFDTVVSEAKIYNGMILIMDEIHRLNKDKQDLLLPQLESGLITLIGMTTSNPYHAINPAIRSRCQLFELNELETTDIIEGLNKAVKSSYLEGITIDDDTIKYIANLAGSDLRYAYKDIGLANPSIGPKVIAAIEAAERVGLPEARIPLGTIVTEMALSPKSNTAHLALDEAIEDIEKGNTGNVPNHIKTDSKEYLYPHDYPNSYVYQEYLPKKLKGKKYYHPKTTGYEKNIKNYYDFIESMKKKG